MANRHKWAEVIEAWANGDAIQFKNATVGRFLDYDNRADFVPCFNDPETDWRVKPRSIMIGDMEVAYPLTDGPERGTSVFIAAPMTSSLYAEMTWSNVSQFCEKVLLRGFVHLNPRAAIDHAKALILVSGGRVE